MYPTAQAPIEASLARKWSPCCTAILVLPKTEGDLSKYTDQGQCGQLGQDAMEWAVVVGVIQGTDDLRLNPSERLLAWMRWPQIMTNFLQGI